MCGNVLPLCAFNVTVQVEINLYLYKFNRNAITQNIIYSIHIGIFNNFKDEN
jgi:hypothetical protein